MKRFILLILTLSMLFITGCGSEESSESSVHSDTTEVESVEEVSVPEETKEPENVNPFLPDPSIFMLRSCESKTNSDGEQKIVFYLTPEEEPLATQYLELLLEGEYNLEEMEVVRDESDTVRTCEAYLKYTGDETIGDIEFAGRNCQVFIGIRTDKDDKTNMTMICSSDFRLVATNEHANQSAVVDSEPDPEPESESEVTKPAESINPSSKELPDLKYFLNTAGTSPHRSYGGMQYAIKKLPIEYKDVLQSEVLTLLQDDRYQLQLINSYRRDLIGQTYYDVYEFTYTGTSELTPLDRDTAGCHVYLEFTYYGKIQKIDILIRYSEEFDVTDPGEKTSLVVEAGNSSDGGDSNFGDWDPEQPEFTKKDCFSCGGSGDCTNCSGYGYIYIDRIKHDCTRCSRGNCPTCKGTGKRD